VQDPQQERVGAGHPNITNYVFELSSQL
jgi:hypothetical protein